MSKVFFIADLHLGHENIIKYCDRPFKTVSEMNSVLIKNWNKTVSSEDKVFVLGDFAFGNKEQILNWGHALNGNKTLILGNHDRASISTYFKAGFREVIKYPILWNDSYILSHGPKLTMPNAPYFNIFGHVHNDPDYEDVSLNGFCVSAERISYTPITFEEIQRKRKKINISHL